MASCVGQIIFMGKFIIFGPVAQIMTRYINMNSNKARTRHSYIKLSEVSRSRLCFGRLPHGLLI